MSSHCLLKSSQSHSSPKLRAWLSEEICCSCSLVASYYSSCSLVALCYPSCSLTASCYHSCSLTASCYCFCSLATSCSCSFAVARCCSFTSSAFFALSSAICFRNFFNFSDRQKTRYLLASGAAGGSLTLSSTSTNFVPPRE